MNGRFYYASQLCYLDKRVDARKDKGRGSARNSYVVEPIVRLDK